MTDFFRCWAMAAAAFLAAGCVDGVPVSPIESGAAGMAHLACEVDLRAGGISCAGSTAGLGGGALGAIVGGQGRYVELSSSNLGYDPGTEVFSADVTVKNLANQVIGTTDGVAPDPDGVRVFFVDDPVTVSGSGAVTVRNPDGSGDFTRVGQPYFQYTQALAPGRTSLPIRWEWSVPSTVERFSFMVGVSAAVADEGGVAPGSIVHAQTISADSLHTCAIDYSGQAWCWGGGGSGRLGNGSSSQQSSPVAVDQGSLRFASISAAHESTCALTDTGEAWCWGNGQAGRLGNGSVLGVLKPTAVLGGHRFIQISSGHSNVCALTAEGQAWCWGSGGLGELGDGTTLTRSQPVAVIGGHVFTMIATGGSHACGITAGGQAWCWGNGTRGTLGNGGKDDIVPIPTEVADDHEFASIHAGRDHVCALTAEGEAWCWGIGRNGKLGNGSTLNAYVPSRVNTSERFVELSLATYHTCGITLDGRGFCWGSNANGKLGIGSVGSSRHLPAEVVDIDHLGAIAAGANHSCAATTTGSVYCWGSNVDGQLGIGTVGESTGTPTLVTSLGPVAFLNNAPEDWNAAADADACFPRRPLNEHLILASSRGAGDLVLNSI